MSRRGNQSGKTFSTRREPVPAPRCASSWTKNLKNVPASGWICSPREGASSYVARPTKEFVQAENRPDEKLEKIREAAEKFTRPLLK
jgi:hypothetical protein